MGKLFKRFSLVTLLLLAFTAFTLSFAAYTVKADSALNLTSFKTTTGAWIRTDLEHPGIRFAAEISAEDYNTIIANENYEIGMAIAKADSVTALKDKAESDSNNVLKAKDADKWVNGFAPTDESATTYKYTFAIIDLADANLNTAYTALAYVKIGESVYYSSNEGETASTRTPLQVAVAHMTANPDDDLDFAKKIADKVLGGESPLAKLAFDKVSYDLSVGGSVTPVVYAGESALSVNVTSNDENIVKVENNTLTGVKSGTTTITVTVKGETSDYTATADVVVGKEVLNVTTAADGVISFDTKGEKAAIKLNLEDSEVGFAENLTEGTYDLYSAIIEYREKYSITDNVSYTVTVESESYKADITTAKFYAIGTAADFLAIGSSIDNSQNYFYLTSNLTFTEQKGLGHGNGIFCGKNDNKGNEAWNTTMNIDGRGYTLEAKFSNSNAGTRYMFDTIYQSNFKNVVIKCDFTLCACKFGSIAYSLKGSNFKNCLFSVNLNIAAKYDTYSYYSMVEEIDNTTFNDCIFDFNIITVETKPTYISNGTGNGGTFNNCAAVGNIASNSDNKLFNGQVNTVSNISVYSDKSDFLATEIGKTWSDAWTITANSLKLLDKEIISIDDQTE